LTIHIPFDQTPIAYRQRWAHPKPSSSRIGGTSPSGDTTRPASHATATVRYASGKWVVIGPCPHLVALSMALNSSAEEEKLGLDVELVHALCRTVAMVEKVE